MSEEHGITNHTIGDGASILQYARPAELAARQSKWPIVLGASQFVWIAFLIYQMLGWDRAVEPVKDSLIAVFMITPSVIAMAMNFRVCYRHDFKSRLPFHVAVCALLFIASVAVVLVLSYSWINFLLLQQRYYPL